MDSNSVIDLTAVGRALKCANVEGMMHALGIKPIPAHEGSALKRDLLEQARISQPHSPQMRHAVMNLVGFYVEVEGNTLFCRIDELAGDLDVPLDVLMDHADMLPAVAGETLEASTVLERIRYMGRSEDYVYQVVLRFLGQHCVALTA